MKKQIYTIEIKSFVVEELNDAEKHLLERAQKASAMAFAPYSAFLVGCAVLLENGEILTGNNQENASFPAGLCAERVALAYANATYPDVSVQAVCIVAQLHGTFTAVPLSPCGICRQTLLECENRFGKPIRLYMAGKDTVLQVDSVKDILPLHFDNQYLLDTLTE
ncbi:MAG: cytidine deaminase [Bacteroidales bacterium]|jgi:cytidine deaminase|nr:cytidine deaminase [Bacteroidales bacterium]